MSEEDKSTEVETAVQRIERRREERAKALADQKETQLVTDLEALDALEEEYGSGRVARLDIDAWKPGFPTFVVVRAPTGVTPNLYKRYSDSVRSAKGDHGKIGAALDQLGTASIVYPADKESRKALLDEFGGVAVSAGRRAVKFVEAEVEDEKKG